MKILIVLLSWLFLVGCAPSFLGVALESMTVSKADDYFDLNSEQKDALKKDVEKDLADVRQHVFPQMADSLRKIDQQTSKNEMSADQVGQIYSDIDQYLKQISTKFEQTAVKTASTLEDDQFRYFEKKVDKEVEESVEDTETPEKALKLSMKRYTKSIEFWFGDLTSAQEEELRKFLKDHPYPWDLQNKNKKFVLAKFMEARKSRDTLKKFVSDYCKDYDAARLPEFKVALDEHQLAFQKFFSQSLWPKMDKEQKSELKEHLLTRAQDLDKLARR